jgi:hypothetical protein
MARRLERFGSSSSLAVSLGQLGTLAAVRCCCYLSVWLQKLGWDEAFVLLLHSKN